MRLTQVDLYNFYVDPEGHFSHDQFQHYVDLVGFKYDITGSLVCYAHHTNGLCCLLLQAVILHVA
jgi:hypothetical protein